MSIIRVLKDKNNPYSVIDNTGLNDKRLTYQARGLLAHLLSKPDNWYVSTSYLVDNSPHGIFAVRSQIKELIKFGYMKKHQSRNNNGKYHHYNYTVYEQPEKPNPTKTTTSPKCSFPLSDDCTLLNTDKKPNTKKNNNSIVGNFNSSKSDSSKPAAVDYYSLEEKKSINKFFEELGIKNSRKIFDSFLQSDILNCSTWIMERNPKMKNPTGFMITALRERWMDQEPIPDKPVLRVFSAECSSCHKSFYYEEYESKYTKCIDCRDKKQPIIIYNS